MAGRCGSARGTSLGGWLRDLTEEGIEPNPGMASGAGDDAEVTAAEGFDLTSVAMAGGDEGYYDILEYI